MYMYINIIFWCIIYVCWRQYIIIIITCCNYAIWPKERTVQCQIEALWANGTRYEPIKNSGHHTQLKYCTVTSCTNVHVYV